MRAWAVLLLATLVLAGCSKPDASDEPVDATPSTPAQPPWTPPPVPAPGLVVVHPNDTWTYRGGTSETPEEIVARVIAATNDTVRLRTTTLDIHANATTTSVSTLDASTLALIELEDGRMGARMRFDPPLPIVIPAEDHAYNGTVTIPSFITITQPASGNITFLGLENVTVPAGTFATYRYDARFRTEGAFTFEQHIEMWFSPEVGQAVKTITDGRVQELVRYDRAG